MSVIFPVVFEFVDLMELVDDKKKGKNVKTKKEENNIDPFEYI